MTETPTGALVEAAFAAARAGALPVPPAERLLAIERVAAQPTRWTARPAAGARLRWNWGDDLAAGLAIDRPEVDRTIVMGFLRHGGPGADSAGIAAARSAPRWAERGERYRLWSPDGPATLATALLADDDPAVVLADAGLAGDLSEGAFAFTAFTVACRTVVESTGDDALRGGTRLIALFERIRVRRVDPALADALLTPWTAADPPRAYARAVTRLLVRRIGDPNRTRARWTWIARTMPGDGAAALTVLRRWLQSASSSGQSQGTRIVSRASGSSVG